MKDDNTSFSVSLAGVDSHMIYGESCNRQLDRDAVDQKQSVTSFSYPYLVYSHAPFDK